MSRIGGPTGRHVVQLVDDESIVFLDESTGAEVAIPADAVDSLIDLLVYFRLSLRATEDGRRRAARVSKLLADDQDITDRRIMAEVDQRIQRHPLDSDDRSAAGDGGWSTHVTQQRGDG